MNNIDFGATTFDDLVSSALDGDETVYASPWIGDEQVEAVAKSVDEVIISRVEDPLLGEEDISAGNVRMVESLNSYLEHRYGDESGLDGEFVAPPGSMSDEIRDTPAETRNMLKKWVRQSDEAVNQEGFTFYSDRVWSDPRVAPLRKSEYEIKPEDINMDTKFILTKYFDRVEQVSGEDYSGVLATRE